MLTRCMAGIAVVVLGACDHAGSTLPQPLLNRCTQAFECVEGDRCDSELGICVRDRACVPYTIALQVLPGDPAPDASVLSPRTTAAEAFTTSRQFGDIELAPSVVLTGSVRDEAGVPIKAEVTFTPEATPYLRRGVFAFTVLTNDGQRFRTELEPNTPYTVQVYPLEFDSKRLPPRAFRLDTGAGAQNVDFTYPAQLQFRGRLVDETERPAARGRQLKLVDRRTGLASSSLGEVDASGAFTLLAPADVLAAPAEHELVLDLNGRNDPQDMSIAFDLTRARPSNVFVMPVLPQPVQFIGTVEVAALSNAPREENSVDALVTLVSEFGIPAETGNVQNRDWCRLKLPGSPRDTFRCSARVQTSVTATGEVMAELYPGDYRVFVAPAGNFDDPQRVATTTLPLIVQTQPNDAAQQGQAFGLSPATLYNGRVASPLGQPMPAVNVTASALGVRDGLPEVALYNRTDEQVSRRDGRFSLAVDVGMYDLIAAPPEGSGYAWVLNYNRRIDGEMRNQVLGGLDLPITPELPVIARGRLVDFTDAGVAGARVEAFAIVPNAESGAERAVRIARTSSDQSGGFALQLPPSIGDRGCGAAAADAGVSDASGLGVQR